MLDELKSSYLQLAEGIKIGRETKLPEGEFDHIVLCGMGGSALAAQLIKDYVVEKIQIDIVQDYFLPNGLVSEKTLVIASSYSGNTQETISCFNDAQSKGFPIIVLSHGGELKDIASQMNVPYFFVPESIQPRCSIGYGLGILLGILEQMKIIENHDGDIKQMSLFISNSLDKIDAKAKELAMQIKGTTPIIYASTYRGALARIFKIHFNENAKTQSFSGVLPEINHNEMAGYTNLLINPTIIYLKSIFDYEKIRMSMEVMQKVLKNKHPDIKLINIELEGNTWLEEINYGLMLAYLSSYYLATEYGIDPVAIDMVDEYKKLIK